MRAGRMLVYAVWMANLPLYLRRSLVKGLNRRTARAWRNRVNLSAGIGNRAVKISGTGNSAIALYAKTPGTGGNAITVTFVAAGNNTPLSVAVAGSAITVNLATNGSAAAISTAIEVIRAINFSTLANPLVHAQRAPGSDGTGVFVAATVSNLAGGV